MGVRGTPASSTASRINGERVVLLCWPRAILMQVAHPLIAAGVSEHSTFRESPAAPIRRLHGTVKAMLGLTFGDAEEQARVIAGIRSIHTRVHGTLRESVGTYPAGTPYSAEDPALLLWVHATLIDSSVRFYEAVVGGMTASDRDRYCRESAPVAIALGADPAAVPREWTAVTEYVRSMIGSSALAVGPDASALQRAILDSPAARMAGPMGWAARQLTVGLLPEDVRQKYGLTFNERDRVRFERLVRTLRRLRAWSPDVVARWGASRRVLHS